MSPPVDHWRILSLTCILAAGVLPMQTSDAQAAAGEAPSDADAGPTVLASREEAGRMLLAYYEKMVTPRPLEVRRGKKLDRHRGRLRRALLTCAGLWPLPERVALDIHTTQPLHHDWCTVRRIYYQVWPGVYNHGFLYIPKTYAERPAPAVLCPHG
ncbi:MAG: hypothetical protein ACE5JM_07180, partial [Armatimonadota bacterium]